MLEKSQKVLREILPRFAECGDANLLLTKLQVSGSLVQDESEMVEDSVTNTKKILRIFYFLKIKPDNTFVTLQKICVELDWTELLTLIRSKLAANNLSELLLSEEEIQTKVKLLTEKKGILISNKNVHFDVKDPSDLFTGREQELVQLHNLIQPSLNESDANNIAHARKCIIITGLGGTGKTQLVLRYAQLYNGEYGNNILWINAESDSSITSSFQRLASERLNLNLKTVEGQEKTISSVVFEVYKFFSNTKALFIFDNADGPFSEYFFPSGDNKPFILITSRMQQWGRIEVFKLNTFTEPDAIRFVKKGLKIANETQEENIKTLVNLFQNFPLALQQAVAFITETNEELQCIGSEYNIAKYLIDFKVKAKSLLDHKINSYIGSHSSATTYTTWKVTTDKIKQNKKNGQLSTKIFNLISCFASNKINPQIFLPLTERDECKLASAVKLLINYSMVNQVDRLLNVHPLVQEITLSDFSNDKNAMEECLQDAQNLLLGYFKLIDNFYERQLFVLPHMESLLSKIKHWIKSNPQEKKINEQENVFNLLQSLIDGYSNYDCKKTILLLEELLKKKEEHFGKGNFQVAATLYDLGNAYGDLGDPKMKKDLLERTLAIEEKHYRPEHYEVARTLHSLGNAYGDLGNPKMQKDLLERVLVIDEKHYGPEHYSVAITLHSLGNAYGDLGDPNMKKDLLERALVIKEKHYGPEHYSVAKTLHSLGNAYGDLGDPKMKKDLLERALVIKEKHYGPEHYSVAITLHSLGNAYGDLGDPKMKKDLLERTMAIEEKHYGPEHYEVPIILHSLGNAYGDLGDPKMKKDLLERALVMQEKHYGPEHYVVALTLHSLGNAYGDLGDPKMKKNLLERALVIQEKHYGPEHYEVVRTLHSLGNAYGDLGDPKMKKDLLERALVIQQTHYGPEHYVVALTLHSLGNAYGDLGDPKMKKDLLERALVMQEKHYGPEHYVVALTLHSLGNAYGDLGDPKMKKDLLERALVMQEKHYGPEHYVVALTLHSLGNAYGDLGDPNMKKNLLERALVIQEKHYGPEHYEVVRTLHSLGNAYGDLGDPKMKKDLLERALVIQEKHYGPEHYEVPKTLYNLGLAYGVLGDNEMRNANIKCAFPLIQSHYGQDHKYTAIVRNNLNHLN